MSDAKKNIQTKEDISKQLEQVKLSPKLKKSLQLIGERAIERQAKDVAQELRDKIAPDGNLPAQQMWLPCAPMPTDMCRVSPFFPMARQDLGQRDFIRDMVIASSSWGEILYTGPKLTTYEEDALTAVLAILDMIEHRKKTDVDGKTTYTYKGPFLPILKLVSPKTQKFGKTNYKRVYEALRLMTVSGVELRINKRTKKGKSTVSTREAMNLLTNVKWDEKTQELTVTINPFFYESFARGSITLLDVLQRSELRSPIAKSLYRFTMSHKGNVWEGHFLTLASALNLDLEQPHKKTKQLIKQAIKRLLDHKLLESDSGIARDSDIVKLHRTQSAKQRRQQNLE